MHGLLRPSHNQSDLSVVLYVQMCTDATMLLSKALGLRLGALLRLVVRSHTVVHISTAPPHTLRGLGIHGCAQCEMFVSLRASKDAKISITCACGVGFHGCSNSDL
jgi:hypothetical protein